MLRAVSGRKRAGRRQSARGRGVKEKGRGAPIKTRRARLAIQAPGRVTEAARTLSPAELPLLPLNAQSKGRAPAETRPLVGMWPAASAAGYLSGPAGGRVRA